MSDVQRAPESSYLTPSPQQLAWQRAGLGMFFHVGVNTFAGREWSDGTVPPTAFDPTDLDADEWVRTARDLGARYVVLTAKHHDGFCLWPTATTRYSVASSPWKDGQGDVVAEVAAACRRHGIGLGLYLSPWDRNSALYPDAAAYDEFYLAQLRELCTGYGPLAELWFDGAGSAGRVYDWERIGELIAQTQPEAMVFNMGPATIRWVGNEDGLASDPCSYVTRDLDLNNYDPDVVSTAAPRYLPPECDVSLRRGWFWQEGEEPKSLPHLLQIHERSIGLGANLLLNVPPDRRGRIDPADAERLRELGAVLRALFGHGVEAEVEEVPAADGVRVDDVLARFRAQVPSGQEIGHVELREDLSRGQVAGAHRVLADGVEIARGESIGVRRLHRVDPPVTASELVIEVTAALPPQREAGPVLPRLEGVVLHAPAPGVPAPLLPEDYRASTDAPID